MYFNLSNINQKTDTGVPASSGKVPPSGTGFDIKRFYVGIDHKFNDIYSANLTMDMQYSSAISSTEFYIKKAYLQAAYSPALTVRLGSTDMPWIPFVEDVYGYRYVEQTLTDRTKFGTSADWGAHVLGKVALADKLSLGYQVSLVNAAGATHHQTQQHPSNQRQTKVPRRRRVFQRHRLGRDHGRQGRRLLGLGLVQLHAEHEHLRALRLREAQQDHRADQEGRLLEPGPFLQPGQDRGPVAGLQARQGRPRLALDRQRHDQRRGRRDLRRDRPIRPVPLVNPLGPTVVQLAWSGG